MSRSSLRLLPRQSRGCEHPLRATVSSAPRIFISYSREDANQAREIRRLLKLSDFDPWMDSADLLAGEAWEQRLTEALRTSDFVVALLSEHSAGGYQDTELRIASDNAPKTPPAGVPFIVPCLTGRFVTEEALIPAFLDKRDLLKIMDGSWRMLHERSVEK
jgi:hypothetical protein